MTIISTSSRGSAAFGPGMELRLSAVSYEPGLSMDHKSRGLLQIGRDRLN